MEKVDPGPARVKAVPLSSFPDLKIDIPKHTKGKVKKYYKKQQQLIDDLEEATQPAYFTKYMQDEEKHKTRVKIAVWLSFCVNILLFFVKIGVLVLSKSISVLASVIDSALDILSGLTIFLTYYITKSKSNFYKYPAGKSRVEPVGIIVFAACMFTATFQVVVEGVRTLTDLEEFKKSLKVTPITISALVLVIVLKAGLWVFCFLLRNESESVRALAQDHRNDVISNLVGLTTLLVGFYWQVWVDPIGGIVTSLYIMYSWLEEGSEQYPWLVGKAAKPEFISKLTWIAAQHDPRIQAIDTVRAYFISSQYQVEMDIVLSRDMKLKDAHDIGQTLQDKIELMEEVERCFVHLDYEFDHAPEHNMKEKGRKLRENVFYGKHIFIIGKFKRDDKEIEDILGRQGGLVVGEKDKIDIILTAKSITTKQKAKVDKLTEKDDEIQVKEERMLYRFYTTVVPGSSPDNSKSRKKKSGTPRKRTKTKTQKAGKGALATTAMGPLDDSDQ